MALPTLDSPRLCIRDWKDSDVQALWNFAKDPRVGPAAGWRPHCSLEDSEKAIAVYRKLGIWAVALRENDLVIGTLELTNDKRRKGLRTLEIGYALSPKFWGRGFMSEAVRTVLEYAFYVKSAEMVSAYCHPQNIRSIRLLESCEFQYEGTLRGMFKRFDGVSLDMRCYSIFPEL